MRLSQEVAVQMVAVEPEHESKLNTNGCLGGAAREGTIRNGHSLTAVVH
jgi:hypothetical protein